MSILIRGMEMPDNCTDCWFRKTARHEYLSDCQLCPFTGDTTPYLTRDKKCPLVPVPPHGRLGDLDALRKRIEENINAAKKAGNHEWWYACTVALDFALAAPTIIPAEEGET